MKRRTHHGCAFLIPSVKVPIHLVLVEGQAIGRAKFGKDSYDVRLLLWREFVFAMMIAIVRAATSAKVTPDTSSGLGHVSLWNVVIELCKAPCFPHQLLLTEKSATIILPSRRIDGWPMMATFWQQHPGLIMHATRFLCAFIVETQWIPHWNIIISQFLFFHI